MPFATIATPLTLLAMALPFVLSRTAAPQSNFWPWVQAWCCGLLVLALVWVHWWRQPRRRPEVDGSVLAAHLGLALLLAALAASGVGLAQYFGGDLGLAPWIHASTPGVAMGNLRQRNQQASLLSMGLWALFWLLAQAQMRAENQQNPVQRLVRRTLAGPGHWPLWLTGLLMAWALALLAVGSAATTSRTGALQWLLMLGLLVLWRRSMGRMALVLAVAGLLLYAAASWLLPQLLMQWTGFATEGLAHRIGTESRACTSRSLLWSNMLTLIAQKPWTGWGWDELGYAHYITLYPGERFCVLLDNAHNLPLHLAVELGLPVTLLLGGLVTWWILRSRPWAEEHPARQLAWGVLLIVGVHSMLEFPLWYGPFQVTCVLALLVLWLTAPTRAARWQVPRAALATMATVWLLAGAALATAMHDYYRVSQLFKSTQARAAAYKNLTPEGVSDSLLFQDHADFALLTTTALTQANAEQMHQLATRLLHYSPEPRVVQLIIESALILGDDDEVAYHLQRFRRAYPDEHARWLKSQTLASTPQN